MRALSAAMAFAVVSLTVSPAARGADTVWFAKVLRQVPVGDAQLAEAHSKSLHASVQVATGEPLSEVGFSGRTSYDVNVMENGKPVRKTLEFDYSRLPVASYGMQLRPQDEANLPSVSRSRILRKVNGNYISLQVRVLRDRTSGAIYLYYKPYAAIGAYQGDSLAQEFAPLMEDSMRDVRGLGLFCKQEVKPSAEAFRTFVAVTRNTLMSEPAGGGEPKYRTNYELILVRARVEGSQVTLHCFGTADERTKIHYIKPYQSPQALDQCSMTSLIFFTDYTLAKQSPSKKALLQVTFNTRASVPMTALDEYVKSQGMQGTAFDNLTEALDALIDGKIK